MSMLLYREAMTPFPSVESTGGNVCVRLCGSACPVECVAYSSGVAN